MRPFRRPLLALLLLLSALPALASAETVASLPAITPSTSARFEIAEAIDGQPYIVGRGELMLPSRMHYVLRTIPTADEPEQSLEVVIFDGRAYVRENDAAQWEAQLLSGDVTNPVAELVAGAEQEGPIERIGSTTIDGIATDQYHILIGNEQERPYITADLWIGQQSSYLYQSQVTRYRGEGDFLYQTETVARAYAFDDPTIMISPPDPATVGPVRGPVPWSAASGKLSTAQLSPLALKLWRGQILQRHLGH